MGRFRLLIVLFITWLVLALNIERPDNILNLGQIYLAPNIYIIIAFIVGVVLLIPNLSTKYTLLQVVFLLIMYWVSKLLITTGGVGTIISNYVTYVEITIVLLTFWITRILSETIINFRETIDRTVLSSVNLGFQTFVYDDNSVEYEADDFDNLAAENPLNNKRIISEEMLRARRYNSKFALFSVRIEGLQKPRFEISSYWDRKAALENFYMRTYIAQILQDLLLDEGDVAVWHQDDLLIGVPENDYTEAVAFAQNLQQIFDVLMDSPPSISFAIFPDDALVYSDLVEAVTAKHQSTHTAASGIVKETKGGTQQTLGA